MQIATIESGLKANNHNGNAATGDDSWGCFQINRFGRLAATRPSADWLVNADNNVSYALGMFKGQGWTPWINSARKAGLR